jgi:hypothetical protein
MNNVDYNVEDAAKAAARAHGVPAWVATEPLIYECAWLSCGEKFATAEACNAHIAEHDKSVGYQSMFTHCCYECDFNDELEAEQTRPSANGGCS